MSNKKSVLQCKHCSLLVVSLTLLSLLFSFSFNWLLDICSSK